MIAVDTNILVRLYTEDDAEQSRAAKAVIEHAQQTEGIFISFLTMVEFVWVLGTYHYSRQRIATLIEKLLQTPGIVVPNNRLLQEAIRYFRTGKASFSDYVILCESKHANVSSLTSFDRIFKKEFPDFVHHPKELV